MKAMFFLFLAFGLLSSFEGQAGDWEDVFQEDGIKVSQKSVEGSSIISFKGVMVAEKNIHELFTVLYDPDHKEDFLQNVIEFRTLKILNDYEGISYVKVGNNLPFIDDRDVILHSKIVLRPKDKQIFVPTRNSDLKLVPEYEGTVRIPKLRSSWLFEALSKTKTRVTYQNEVDPGGFIPKWLVNLASKRLPFGTLQKLRELSEKKEALKRTSTFLKYFINWEPYLGKNHLASKRTKEEALSIQAEMRGIFKQHCEAGSKDSCVASKNYVVPFLRGKGF